MTSPLQGQPRFGVADVVKSTKLFIQAMLGHELLSTTETYTKVAIRKLQEVHAETHHSAKMARAHTDDDVTK